MRRWTSSWARSIDDAQREPRRRLSARVRRQGPRRAADGAKALSDEASGIAARSDRDQCVGGHRHGRGRSMTHSVSHGEDYQPVFVGKVLDELQTVLKRYPTKQAALLPALWIAQREQGWISDRVMAEVAEVLGITPAYVKG